MRGLSAPAVRSSSVPNGLQKDWVWALGVWGCLDLWRGRCVRSSCCLSCLAISCPSQRHSGKQELGQMPCARPDISSQLLCLLSRCLLRRAVPRCRPSRCGGNRGDAVHPAGNHRGGVLPGCATPGWLRTDSQLETQSRHMHPTFSAPVSLSGCGMRPVAVPPRLLAAPHACGPPTLCRPATALIAACAQAGAVSWWAVRRVGRHTMTQVRLSWGVLCLGQ